MINGLDLFSGIGGLSLAIKPWVRTVAYCEIDRYCRGVLLSRMVRHQFGLDRAPIWDDIRTLTFGRNNDLDIIFGGFPCQDISVAGSGAGLEGKRSGLFFEVIRLTKELKPTFVFLENVPAIRTRGLETVIGAFDDLGYDCRWTRVSAAEVGAPHRRERWFLLAYSSSKRLQGLEYKASSREAHPEVIDSSFSKNWTDVFDQFPRMDNGIPRPVDRIKALGNSVVPLQARTAFKRLMGLN